MLTPVSQPRTSIVDLPEEDRELSAEALLLIVGGSSGCDNEADTQNTGNRDCDAPKMN
jgi:hypothetical protein